MEKLNCLKLTTEPTMLTTEAKESFLLAHVNKNQIRFIDIINIFGMV